MRRRSAVVKRKTRETDIVVKFDIDGTGRSRVRTGIGFLDHMLESFARHGLFDLELRVKKSDLYIDLHHTNEDAGIVLGEAFKKALGDKRGIRRFADFRAPLDEALTETRVSIDVSGRGSFHLHTQSKTKWIAHAPSRAGRGVNGYTFADAKHFLESFSRHAGITLHVDFISGEYPHHVLESLFKSLAKALDWAAGIDERVKGVPSTKGKL
ncbi:MAG: imidazoleglycerol-phosphate dehydratase [Candidatus Omnitrophica bacterium]|nr:imidazoleglycerol-phosphate dehydratase [Candidatus Omnitrophota bacterium]